MLRIIEGLSAAALALCAGLIGAPAIAQGTLGELLDAGAVKLTKQEVLNTVIGATVVGPGPGGGAVQTLYKADGTYTGSYQGGASAEGAGKHGGFFGRWTLDESGRLCVEGTGGAGKAAERCMYFYRRGDQLFTAMGSDSNRAAPVQKRSVRRN